MIEDVIFSGRQWQQVALSILQREGVSLLVPMPPPLVGQIIKHYEDKPVFNAHVTAKATEPPVTMTDAAKQKRWPMFCHAMADVVAAPFWFETAIGLLGFARAYFGGEMPRLYSMNTFWTQNVDAPKYLDTHWWHRDGDDRKQLTLFMYGTDVDVSGDGAHLYQRGTHLIPDHALRDEQGNSRNYAEPNPSLVETFIGPAGTMFVSDTGGLHMGLRPKKLRMLTWARFGVSNPPQSYLWDKMSPVSKDVLGNRYPKSPELQEAIRLVVA